ncbi:hypothetical protein N1851_003060 [Merluccius polli]|uniref:Uncharacterized protein n=1 Tax=Merluccius polli TaxID=89951 RepID=A0AA47N908_MERPO|nr:hypothetical protein N1851_003060 [Merluccius polli]
MTGRPRLNPGDESVGSSPDMRLSQKKRKRTRTRTLKTSNAPSDLLGKVRREPRTEDGKSDTDDESVGSSPDMRLSQKKRKQTRTRTLKTSNAPSDLLGKVRREPRTEDGKSDTDDEGVGSSPDMRLSQKKRKQTRTRTLKTSNAPSDLLGKVRREPRTEDGKSDTDDEGVGSSPDMRLSQKKRKQTRTRTLKTSNAPSDLLGKVRREPRTEDGKSDTDVGDAAISTTTGLDNLKDGRSDADDQEPGLNVIERESGERPKSKEITKARRGWSEAERTAVHKHLDAFIKQRQIPGKEACMKCINKEKVLGKRTWKDVKNLVYNRIVTLNRRSASRNLKF